MVNDSLQKEAAIGAVECVERWGNGGNYLAARCHRVDGAPLLARAPLHQRVQLHQRTRITARDRLLTQRDVSQQVGAAARCLEGGGRLVALFNEDRAEGGGLPWLGSRRRGGEKGRDQA